MHLSQQLRMWKGTTGRKPLLQQGFGWRCLGESVSPKNSFLHHSFQQFSEVSRHSQKTQALLKAFAELILTIPCHPYQNSSLQALIGDPPRVPMGALIQNISVLLNVSSNSSFSCHEQPIPVLCSLLSAGMTMGKAHFSAFLLQKSSTKTTKSSHSRWEVLWGLVLSYEPTAG